MRLFFSHDENKNMDDETPNRVTQWVEINASGATISSASPIHRKECSLFVR
jgi:hypothetical protein